MLRKNMEDIKERQYGSDKANSPIIFRRQAISRRSRQVSTVAGMEQVGIPHENFTRETTEKINLKDYGVNRSILKYILQKKWGYAVAQLVEALRYKPEGRWFDSRWSHWNFSVT
jgi:hypothetical protein